MHLSSGLKQHPTRHPQQSLMLLQQSLMLLQQSSMFFQHPRLLLLLVLVVLWTALGQSLDSADLTNVAMVARRQAASHCVCDDRLVFQHDVGSMLQCARMCSQDNGCLTFTFTAEDMLGAGSCRGHGQDSMSAHLVPDDKYTSFVVFAVMMAPSSATLNGKYGGEQLWVQDRCISSRLVQNKSLLIFLFIFFRGLI